MDRPHESNEKRVVDARRRIAQRHAQRAAVLARRSAAARRRLALVLGLLALTAGAWTAVGLGALGSALFAVVPSVLLLATVALGRAAVVSAQRSDAAWALEEKQLTQAVRVAERRRGPVATGRAVRGNEDDTLVIEKVSELAPTPVAGLEEDSWQPVPVPRPTYTLKAPAPRREPAPLEIPERTVAEPAASAAAPEELAEPAAGLDLDAILARRRAVGE